MSPRPPQGRGDQWGKLHACSNGFMGFFDKFRQPKTPHPHNSPTPLQPSSPPPEETWPWPNIDSPSVQLLQERAAFHEAGHAVIARCFGIKVIQLSLRLRAGSSGRVFPGVTPAWQRAERYDDLRRRADRNPESRRRIPVGVLRPRSLFDYEESLQAELHTCLAGSVAEEMQFSSYFDCSRGDWSRFHLQVSCCYGNLTGFVSGSSIALLRHRYWNSCKETLSKPENWTWVEAVAKGAIRSENGVLTGDEIDSLRPRRPLPPNRPTSPLPLMCMADETSEGSVADAAIFERVARLVADLYGVEFEGLSTETTIEDIEATAVSVWPRGANRKFLSVAPALVLLEVENEFGLLFEEEEISDLGDSEGFMPLGLLVDFVQGKLMEKRGLSPPA